MLARLGRILGAVALSAVLVTSTYGAHAGKAPTPAQHARSAVQVASDRFVAPVPHPYRPDGLRMGLHCETASMAMP